ncbi:MAG: hypothetical protein IJ270_01780 [Paludibacteraceae bacterium]|nr:hypothetical protein [Paludibacteraceae bacterium]
MKNWFRKSLLIIGLALISINASAKKKCYLGEMAIFRINSGLSASFFNPEGNDNYYPYLFYTGGIGIDYAMRRNFYMQTEVDYLRTGNVYSDNFITKSNYFDNLDFNTSFNFKGQAGPFRAVFGAGIYGICAMGEGYQVKDHPELKNKENDYHSNYRTWNVGGVGNVGFLLNFGFINFGIRYKFQAPFLTTLKDNNARNFIHTIFFTIGIE